MLYERLTNEFQKYYSNPRASGSGRFDQGMYYAPQGWTSDDSDAIERLKIQYELLCVIRSAVWEAMCLLSRITRYFAIPHYMR